MLSYHLQGPIIEFFHKKSNQVGAKRVILRAKRAGPPQELAGRGRPSAGRLQLVNLKHLELLKNHFKTNLFFLEKPESPDSPPY